MRGSALGGLLAAGLAACSTLALSTPAWAKALQQVQGGYSQTKTLAHVTRPKPDPPDPQWPASVQGELVGILGGAGFSPEAAQCIDNIMIHTYRYQYYLQHDETQADKWVTTYLPQLNACVVRYPA
jgi:hypothetical protein